MRPSPPDCPIPGATGMCSPEGTGSIGVLILGEALGEAEANDGLPFRPYAQAGSLLERAIRRAGFDRRQFVLWNTVPVRPPNNYLEGAPYEAAAVAWGIPQLHEIVRQYKPRCILALGGIALRAVSGLVGDYRSVSHLRGFVLPSNNMEGIPVVGTFHPAFLRRGAMPLFSVLMHDLKLAVAVAACSPAAGSGHLFDLQRPGRPSEPEIRHKSPVDQPCPLRAETTSPRLAGDLDVVGEKNGRTAQRTTFFSPVLYRDFEWSSAYGPPLDMTNPIVPSGYITHPGEGDAWDFLRRAKDDPRQLITYDIETPRSAVTTEDESDELADTDILSIQLSLAVGTGIFLPWRPPYTEVARLVLALPNAKAGANTWRFDDPLLRAHGCQLNGTLHDARWAWHHLQPDLRAGLQFIASFYPVAGLPHVPWKHLHASHPEYYGIMDVDVLQRIFHVGICGAWHGTV